MVETVLLYKGLRLLMKIIIGSVCVHLAKKKNRNPYLAFVAGYILTFIALVYYLYINYQKKSHTGEFYLKCNKCGEVFKDDKKFCPNCKVEVNKKTTKKV